MPSWEFPAHDPVDLRVRVPSGDITVTAAATQTATVTLDGNERILAVTRVEFDDGALSIVVPDQPGLIRDGSVDAVVELPEGSSCRVNTASADIQCTGDLVALDAHTASGDVSAERVSGPARVDTASGDVSVGQAGEANVESASGDVQIGWARGNAEVRTASGDIQIEAASGHRTDVKSASGDISIGVAPGIGVYLDLSSLSGTVSSELEPGDETGGTGGTEMRLSCRTISGDVRVSRAAPAAAR
jgi:Putative adhesin